MSAQSIRQNPGDDRLPDFRNMGVLARVLLIASGVALVAALARARSAGALVQELADIAAQAHPVLLLQLLALAACAGLLRRLSYWPGAIALLALALIVTTVAHWLERNVIGVPDASIARYWAFTATVVAIGLGYFHLRARALSPALSEARLQALQARIRPHFLFNSLNAVLSLIRADPRRAERALEDMAELFRVLMADNSELTPLAREVDLCRQYLDLEQLRLGDRLRVEWHVDNMPRDALVPPLCLQPLLENAVYHGIEPRTEPGTVTINVYRRGDQVHAVLRNPYRLDGSHHAGNKMAVGNIRERLALHFDAEASLRAGVEGDSYQVHIVVPYRQAPAGGRSR